MTTTMPAFKTREWQNEEKNEQLVMQQLGWTELQVAQSSAKDIAQALQQHAFLKKRDLPAVVAPEPIVKLAWPRSVPAHLAEHKHDMQNVSPTSTSPQVSSQVAETTSAPADLAELKHDICPSSTAEKASPSLTSPQISPQIIAQDLRQLTANTTPQLISNTALPVTSACEGNETMQSLGKTPGFMRNGGVHATEPQCGPGGNQDLRFVEMSTRLNELLKRRADHDVLLANPNLESASKQALLLSFERTNQYIWDAMHVILLEKAAIASALQTKRALLSWAGALADPQIVTELARDISNLSASLTVLNTCLPHSLKTCSA